MKISHIFQNVDFRCSHHGLKEIAMDKTKKVELSPNDYVMFLNTKRNMVKIFCGDYKLLLFYKADQNRPIDPKILVTLTNYIKGNKIEYNKASAALLRKTFKQGK